MTRSIEIQPRNEGGWKLILLEDGEEVGGGVYEAGDEGYCDALEAGEEWGSTA